MPRRPIKNKRRTHIAWGRLVWFLFLAAGLVYLFYRPELFIKNITIVGNHWTSQAELRAVAAPLLLGERLFTYPRAALEQSFRQSFPVIASASVHVSGWSSVTITITERQPVAIWCGEIGGCYFVDATGTIFASAPHFSRPLFVTITGPLPASPLGLRPISAREWATWLVLQSGLPELQTATRAEAGDYRATFLPQPGRKPFTLILGTRVAPETTIFNLRAALAMSALGAPVAAGSVEYIDLRFSPRVFYRLRE